MGLDLTLVYCNGQLSRWNGVLQIRWPSCFNCDTASDITPAIMDDGDVTPTRRRAGGHHPRTPPGMDELSATGMAGHTAGQDEARSRSRACPTTPTAPYTL